MPTDTKNQLVVLKNGRYDNVPMIELYRPIDCPTCADIEMELKEMVVAHKVISIATDQIPNVLPKGTSLPALKENGKIITGQAAIAIYLTELEQFVVDWRRFQSDARYIDNDGDIC